MHPLFPVIDGLHRKVSSVEKRLSHLETKIVNLQGETNQVVQLQKELLQLMKQHQKKNYSLADDGFDVR